MMSYSRLREEIAALQKTDLASADSQVVRQRLTQLLMSHVRWVDNCVEGQELYRGRKVSTLITHISEIGAREHSYCNSFQRANFPGQSMFYASTDVGTVIEELAVNVGESFLLSKWLAFESFPVSQIGISKSYKIRSQTSPTNSKLTGTLIPDPNTPANRLVDRFLTQLFTKKGADENDYKVSAAVANILLDPEHKEFNSSQKSIHGLIYPSIASTRKSVNLAVRKHIADQVLGLSAMQLLKLAGRSADGKWLLTTSAIAYVEATGKILWNSGKPTNELIPSTLRATRTDQGEFLDTTGALVEFKAP